MRKLVISILAIIVVLCTNSCKDRNGIDMVYTREFNIEFGANTWDTHYHGGDFIVNTNWSEFLGEMTADDINEILPAFATLTNTEGINMDFIRRAVIEIFPNGDTSLTPIEMCFREDIPLNTGTTLQLISGIYNFKDELTDGKFTFRIGLNYRDFPPQTFRVVLDMGFQAFPK